MTSPAELLALAVQYHASGNSALAEQYAASIVAADPNHADALHLLGLIHQQKGSLHDAMAYLRRSLTANGANPLTWQHAGDLLFAQGDLAGGITYYEQVLRLRPDFAEGYNALGLALLRTGKLTRAVECFQQARRVAPSFAQALNNLGVAMNFQGKWAEAAAAFEEALRLRPENAEILYNLGNARFYEGDLGAAIICYRRALDLRPANAAEVSNSLASALRMQGKHAEAVALYQEALRLKPGHAESMYQLSEMAAQGHYDFPPQEVDAIKETLIAGHCGDEDGHLYAFAAAHVLDRQGAFGEAFRYFREANERLLRVLAKRNAAFNAQAHRARVDKIIADFGPAHFKKVQGRGIAAEAPIFLVGMPYSGTALVEEMLAAHPKVQCAVRGGSVLSFLAQFSANTKGDPLAAPCWIDRETMQATARAYLRSLNELGRHAERVLVSSLDQALALGVLATLFSGARIISCRRRPVEVALACYFNNRRDLTFACSPEDIGAYLRAHEKLMAHWARTLPLAIHEVDFEALVQDRENTTRALHAYCGLEWDERCASVPASSREVAAAHWQNHRVFLGPLMKALES